MTVTDLPAAHARSGDLRQWAAITWLLAQRTFRLRYLRSRLGIGWAIVQPLLQAGVLAFLFTRVFKVTRGEDYLLYVLSGVMTWQLFAGAVNGATTSAVDNGSLLRKISVPPLVFPLASIGAVLLVFSLQAVVLLVAAGLFGTLGPEVLLLPLAVLLLAVVAAGVGTLACAFHVAHRDVKFFVESGLLLLFYATPVLYDPASLSDDLRTVLALNPVYGVESLVRAALVDRPLDGAALATSCASAVVLLALGLLAFSRRSPDFADLT